MTKILRECNSGLSLSRTDANNKSVGVIRLGPDPGSEGADGGSGIQTFLVPDWVFLLRRINSGPGQKSLGPGSQNFVAGIVHVDENLIPRVPTFVKIRTRENKPTLKGRKLLTHTVEKVQS